MYGTTDRFLRCFSLNSLDDLPALPDTEEIEKLNKDDSQTSLFDDDNKRDEILTPLSDEEDKEE